MTVIYKIVKDSFSAELSNEGAIWRIFRKGTLVDLIKLSFYQHQNDGKEKHFIDIFNFCMKIKLLNSIKIIEVKGTMQEMISCFNKEHDSILQQYDTIYFEIEPTFKDYKHTGLYDLYGKIEYIKVVNDLEIDSYADDIFDEILGITANLLSQKRIEE
jgi:hypothetical protein